MEYPEVDQNKACICHRDSHSLPGAPIADEAEGEKLLLHPKAQLSARSTRAHPVLSRVKSRDCRDSRNAIPAELGELLTIACVDIYETIHVSNDETLDAVLWRHLPARTQSRRC